MAAALKSGNPEIKDILKEEGGLRAAREMLLRHEAERVAQIQRQQRHDLAVLGRRDPGHGVPAGTGGPGGGPARR